MDADIHRQYRDDEVVLSAFTEAGREWMSRRYPGRFNPVYQLLILKLPDEKRELDEFIEQSEKRGLLIRDVVNTP